MSSLACLGIAGTVRGEIKSSNKNNNNNDRKLLRKGYSSTDSSTLSSASVVRITMENDSSQGKKNKNKSTPAPTASPTSVPTASPTRSSKDKKSENKYSNKRKSTPAPTASPTLFHEDDEKENKNSNKIKNTSAPTASPTLLHNKDDESVHNHEIKKEDSDENRDVKEPEINVDDTPNQQTRSPKSAPQISINIFKVQPPTIAPSRKPSTSESQPNDTYDSVTLKSFDVHLIAEDAWNSGFDHLVQRALERHLSNSIFLPGIGIHNAVLTIASQSYKESKAWFRFQGRLLIDPVDDIRLDPQTQVWKQQSIALVDRMIIQLRLDEDPILVTGKVTLMNVVLLSDESAAPVINDHLQQVQRISDKGRKALIVISLIVAFVVAVGIGVWCFSPVEGYEDDDSRFGSKPRESFSQAATDEIVVDHDDAPSVCSSLTGTPREDCEPSSNNNDSIYLMEFVNEPIMQRATPRMEHDSAFNDDQDSFYSEPQPYFYKRRVPDRIAAPVSKEPSVYSILQDPQRRKQYASSCTEISRDKSNSTIATSSILMDESTSLPAASSIDHSVFTIIHSTIPQSIALSESMSLRQRIASHLAEHDASES